MPLDIKQIFTFVFLLLTIAFLFSAVSYSIIKILIRIYRWLYKRTRVANKIHQAQVAIQNYWKENLPTLSKLWEYFYEVFSDPLFYGYALVVLVDKIQSIQEYTKQNPQYNFYQILDQDMNIDTNFYMVFFLIFTLWMLGKVWKRNQEAKGQKSLKDSLENISKNLEKLNRNINKLSRNLNIKRKGE